MFRIYTNKKEKEEFGKLLTKSLNKNFPFVIDVEVYELNSTDFMFEIACYVVVSKQFIIDNVNMNYSGNIISPGEIKKYVSNGLMPTYAFNLASKKIKFKIEEFIKLSQMLFYSLYGRNATTSTYSVQFKIV
jgi:hypothetical protein